MLTRPFKVIGDAFVNIFRNKLTTLFTVVSVTSSLAILGLLFVIILNINILTLSASEQFDTITAFFDENLKAQDIQKIVYDIEDMTGVDRTEYLDKEKALENLKDSWGENAYLLEDLEDNPLPRSLIIHLKDISYTKMISERIEKIKGIESVRSYQKVVKDMMTITSWVRSAGSVLIFILIGISTILIHNVIRLAIQSRDSEIKIMKYLGASNWYIRWPFVVEGILIGLIGAGLSFALIYYSYEALYESLQKDFFLLISQHVVRPEFIMRDIGFLFVVIGTGVGALGSIISTRRSLNV